LIKTCETNIWKFILKYKQVLLAFRFSPDL
jgi:hypothetical protein